MAEVPESPFQPCADPLPACDEDCVCRPTMRAIAMQPVVDAAMDWWWETNAREDTEMALANVVWEYRVKMGMEDV